MSITINGREHVTYLDVVCKAREMILHSDQDSRSIIQLLIDSANSLCSNEFRRGVPVKLLKMIKEANGIERLVEWSDATNTKGKRIALQNAAEYLEDELSILL